MKNPISVTETRCSCGYLERGSLDPNSPLKYDPNLTEYSFEHTLAQGTKVSTMIYHCPMCGGVAPPSRRDELFASIPAGEASRLRILIRGIETLANIERVLGVPDRDEKINPPPDLVVADPIKGERETVVVRVLTYTRLSNAADVQFNVFSNGVVDGGIMPKYVGP